MQTFKLTVNQNGIFKPETYQIADCIICGFSLWNFDGFSEGNKEHLAYFECLNCGDATQDYPADN